MNLSPDGQIKKLVGRERPNTPQERLDQLWQMYLFWKSTPAGQQEQPIPPHVRKIVSKRGIWIRPVEQTELSDS